MKRRELLAGSAALAAATMTSTKVFASSHGDGPMPHPYAEVLDSISECLETGNMCIAHCAQELAKGNTNMAECNVKVQEMLAMCEAMMKLASFDSPLARDIATACIKACDRCEKACAKHASHHAVCKACADACKKCISACRKAFK